MPQPCHHCCGSSCCCRCPDLQSGVLYGYKVAGNGGWETPYRWDKNKVGARLWCVVSMLLVHTAHWRLLPSSRPYRAGLHVLL